MSDASQQELEPIGTPQAAREGAGRRTQWILGILLVALLGVAYFDAMKWMVLRWPLEPYSGGGFLIPPMSAYIIWLKREDLRRLPKRGSGWGIPVLIFAGLLYLVGSWTGIHYPYAISMLFMVWGMVLWLWGTAVAAHLAFPIAFLFFMLPLSSALDPFIFNLRLVATRMASWLPIALGLPTEVNGTEIHVGKHYLLIDLPCSGIRFVVALQAGGALFAYFAQSSLWRRALLFCTALPVAIFTNVLRIDLTLLLGETFGQKAAEGFFHEASGMFVFVFALVILYYLSRWICPWQDTD